MAYAEMQSVEKVINEWVPEQRQLHHFVGLSITLRQGRDSIFASDGYSDVGSETPLTCDDTFVVASQTKPVTAAACVMLAAEGKVDLDDRISSHLPIDKSQELANVTIQSLLQHTSGLMRDASGGKFWDLLADFPTRDEILDHLTDQSLIFAPGERMKYSNLGYAILGLLIENVSGIPYEEFIRKNIFERLDLQSTTFDITSATVKGHKNGDLETETLGIMPTDAYTSATGLTSSFSDMLTIYDALVQGTGNETLLSEETKKKMFATVQVPHIPGAEYGLGLNFGKYGKNTFVGHGGGYLGQMSFTAVDPVNERSVAVLINSIEANAIDFAVSALMTLDFFRANGAPRKDAAHLEGNYHNLWATKRLIASGKGLHVVSPQALYIFSGTEMIKRRENGFVIEGANGFDWDGEEVVFDAVSNDMLYAGRVYEKEKSKKDEN